MTSSSSRSTITTPGRMQVAGPIPRSSQRITSSSSSTTTTTWMVAPVRILMSLSCSHGTDRPSVWTGHP